MSCNEFIGIVSLEVLMDLISCHGLIKKESTVILLFCTRFVEYYLEKKVHYS